MRNRRYKTGVITKEVCVLVCLFMRLSILSEGQKQVFGLLVGGRVNQEKKQTLACNYYSLYFIYTEISNTYTYILDCCDTNWRIDIC